MLYYIFKFLKEQWNIPGAGLFQYISFRAAMSVTLSLIITIVYGKNIINFLRNKQIGETIRELGLQGENQKKGTPTMGGLMILGSILIPTLLFARIDNVYILLMLISTIWLGIIGFADDYIKVFKKNKEGLSGKFKVVGQIGLGIIVGLTMYFNQHIKVREFAADGTFVDHKSLLTTVPFMKDNQFDYNMLLPSFIPDEYVWIVYVLVVIFIITAVSNGANITDGIDGLAAGTSVIIGIALAILAYVSGNKVISQYLNVMFIPNSGELAVFCAAFVGACIGFLWYNAYPAQVFMGDTGSLALGGIIAVLAIIVRKELLIPILCGVFVAENLSVMLQVGYFKYTKRKYGSFKTFLF